MKSHEELRQNVRAVYGQISRAGNGCCGPAPAGEESCCGGGDTPATLNSLRLGYSAQDLGQVPEGADLGLGCGNPRAIAGLRAGETVLDLGSGAGFDCFLAAREVGEQGRVIGVDMTHEMLSKARANAARGGYRNVEFRLGEIEHLPVADASVDVIISNCVINLSPDKPQVFRDAFRVLKSGGRLAISDVVARAELPAELKQDEALYCGCMGGAETPEALRAMLADAGFTDIRIEPKDDSHTFIRDWAPGRNIEDYVVSAYIEARK